MNPTVFLVILLLLVITFFRSPVGKGILGEYLVNIAIKLLLDKKKYFLLKDVTLPAAEGTTQIDHVIVSAYGIFVIETKNMKGWIFGGEDQSTWTQKIYKKTHKFQNPLRQNYKHVKTLETLLKIHPSKIFSLITFVGDSTFKTPMPENVTQGIGFIRYIKNKQQIVLSPEDCKTALPLINEKRLDNTQETRRAHVDYLNQKHGNNRAGRRDPLVLLQVGLAVLLVMVATYFLSNILPGSTQDAPSATVNRLMPAEVQAESPGGEDEVIYRWVDEYGKTHYSNIGAPEGYQATELQPRGYKFEE